MTSEEFSPDDVAAVERSKESYERIRGELAKVIVGQEEVIEQVLIAILARGHALLEGVPGLAKTLLISSLAEATHLSFKRIQFTPDLMPSDITGTEIIQEDPTSGQRGYKFLPGPMFANMILAAEIYHADEHDTATLEDSLHQAQTNQEEAGSEQTIEDAVADKGYHGAETLANVREHTPYRTYIPEPQRPQSCVWTDKPPEFQEAVVANRRRTRGKRGRKLQRLRSERVERSFAHVCETGGARRTWLTGIEKVRKRYLLSAAAHNLGVLMRSLFRMGTPRSLQQFKTDLDEIVSSLYLAWIAAARHLKLSFPRTTLPRTLRDSLSQQPQSALAA